MDAQYIKLAGLWTIDDRFKGAVELRVETNQESGLNGVPAAELTAIQMFGFNTGNPLSGQAILDPRQLRELHEVIGKRLVELDETAEQS